MVSQKLVQAMLCKVSTASFMLLETLIDYTANNQYCSSAVLIPRNEISVVNKENVTLKIENLTTSNPGTGSLRVYMRESSSSSEPVDIPLGTEEAPLNDEFLLNDKVSSITINSVQLILLAGNYYANGRLRLYSCERREKPKNAHKYYIDAVYNVGTKQAFISYGALPNGGWRIGE